MSLAPRYNPQESEARWQAFWETEGIYRFDPSSGREVYSIDTPPPTVSGKLHIGHVFSYTQTEIVARYQRQLGKEVMYPFGFDDNGLPTEILTEREKGVKGSEMPRADFVHLCEEVSTQYREQFKALWQRLGFSCDWDSAYSTISESSQRISQRSFLDLLDKQLVRYDQTPTLWCTKCQTAFAQAEVDDEHKGTVFNYLNFATPEGEAIPIATTRPELLAGCVAMFIHPDNAKYAHLIGGKAVVPLFGHEVDIIADPKADPEKGTGIVMCCTYGDVTDIDWWREHGLATRVCFTDDGRMNERAGDFAGLTIAEARAAIIERLLADGAIFKQEDLPAENRVVNVHERCGTPVEYLPVKQWFINVMEHKDELLQAGAKVNWYPEYMGKRYRDWVENLSWDWAISRQRYFGVPIPVWYAPDGTVVPASLEQLPVNPLTDKPLDCKGYDPESLIPEADVLDTWATSSVTPELNQRWGEPDEREGMRPMSMRPQAHDIIRTWAFYTIVKSWFHFRDIPWKDAVISGHVIKKEQQVQSQQVEGKGFARKSKISKSKDGDQFSPLAILDRFGADPVRYWASSGTLGTDIAFDEDEIESVGKLITKLWNSSRFAAGFLEGFVPGGDEPALEPVDCWALGRFNKVIAAYHKAFDRYEFFPARNELERFFWNTFCDNYLELVKHRLWDTSDEGAASREAAQWTLQRLLMGQLQLFAPYLVHVTEEIYQALLREGVGATSIHVSGFPEPVAAGDDADASAAGDRLVELLTLVRTFKSKKQYSMKLPADRITIACDADSRAAVERVATDLRALAKIDEIAFADELEDAFEDASEHFRIALVMNPRALSRTELVGKIKPIITELKKAQGLKAKNPVDRLLVRAEGDALSLLQDEPEQLAYAAKAGEVVFNPEAGEFTEVSGTGVSVALG